MLCAVFAGLFSVSSMSGQVTVSRSLKNYAGVYNITIAAWNTNSASNRNSTLVTITVLPAITGTPPVWKQPNTDFVSYSVLEVTVSEFNLQLTIICNHNSIVVQVQIKPWQILFLFFVDEI